MVSCCVVCFRLQWDWSYILLRGALRNSNINFRCSLKNFGRIPAARPSIVESSRQPAATDHRRSIMAEDKTFKPGPTLRRHSAVLSKLELPGDVLLVLYFAVLTRQYLWWLTGNNLAAWFASAVVAAIIGWFYVSTKEPRGEKGARLPFWLVAVLPLVFVYSMRFRFPRRLL